MTSQLILVEGIPSSGKSTTAERIARLLQDHGQSARWIWEGELLGQWFSQSRPIEQVHKLDLPLLLADWQTLIDAVASSEQTWIVDGALTFTLATPLLGSAASAATVSEAIAELWRLCSAVPTRVVHVVGDIATLVNTSYVTRGPRWRTKLTEQVAVFPLQQARGLAGEAGVIAFYEQAQPALKQCCDPSWPLLTLDRRSLDRTAAVAAIAAFLGYPAPSPTPIEHFMPQFLGAYAACDPNDSARLCFVQQPHGIILTNGTDQIGTLDVLGSHELQLAGTPYRFTFSDQSPALVVTLGDGTREEYDVEPASKQPQGADRNAGDENSSV